MYTGTYEGHNYKSQYPYLYRTQYREFLAGRLRDIDKVISATSEIDARSKITGDIRSQISVEFVCDLSAPAANQ